MSRRLSLIYSTFEQNDAWIAYEGPLLGLVGTLPSGR